VFLGFVELCLTPYSFVLISKEGKFRYLLVEPVRVRVKGIGSNTIESFSSSSNRKKFEGIKEMPSWAK
jgi:hypothetical protein